MAEEQCRVVFDMFDADKSGKISKLELVKALRQCPGVEDDAQAASMSLVSTIKVSFNAFS